ncbi:MAG: DUF1833 family protein [Maricaulis sp.]|uniref:DUF1833 family protein n=1 Tax=Maricaulis sp. TaxID=1486257 RepID=UPI0032988BA5
MPSRDFVAGVVAQETDEVYLALVSIYHPDLADLGESFPELDVSGGRLRFVNNTVDIESRGNTFTAYGFDLVLPGQGEGDAGLASITIDNVDQRIALVLRSLTTALDVSVEIVLAADPDTVEMTLPDMRMVSASGDRLQISGDLAVDDDSNEQLVSFSFLPAHAPALF